MRNGLRRYAAAAGVALVAISTAADAQWALIARRAIGRVEQMSQQSQQSDGASYDSAAVMLDAPADKVYAAVLRGLANAQGITITREEPADRLVQFTNGQQIAGIKVSALSDDITHMLISSAHTGSQPNAAELVLNAVLRVCKDMSVECSQAKQ
ncbi:MAG TPA: hypothetical protein VMN56_14630 [Casimicrobiaceae bacterium]|nr:hypothetical protein [Casimicrobiaceae bacterium]